MSEQVHEAQEAGDNDERTAADAKAGDFDTFMERAGSVHATVLTMLGQVSQPEPEAQVVLVGALKLSCMRSTDPIAALDAAIASLQDRRRNAEAERVPAALIETFTCDACPAQVQASFLVDDHEPQPAEAKCEPCGMRYSCRLDWVDDEDGGFQCVTVVRWWCKHGVVDHEQCTTCEVLEDVRGAAP